MTLFLLLLTKLIPAYATVGLGFIAGRVLQVQRESVAKIVFYLLVPCVMFAGVMRAEFTVQTFLLPLLTYAMSSALSLTAYAIARRIWKDATANILGCTAGTGNTGYFGLPVAAALFDENTVAVYILMLLGVTLAESSVGYFIAARGHAHWRDALKRVARLPTIYAFLLGLAFRLSGVTLPGIGWDFLGNVRAAYALLGMMIVGLGIAGMPRLHLDAAFTAMAFAMKFLAWPLLALGVRALDTHLFHIYGARTYDALFLMSIVPMAANTVVIASLLDIVPEKVASTVLLSTLLAIIYVPLMVALFIK